MYINADWAGDTVAWLQHHKIKTRPLFESLGINQRDLKFGQQISIRHFAAILNYGSSKLDDDHFGLHRGFDFHIKKGGLLAHLAATAETVSDAVLHYQRYASVVCDGFSLELRRDREGTELVLHVADPSWATCRHVGEFSAARIVAALRKITGVNLRPLFVCFMHDDGSSASECRRHFNCDVRYAARADIIKLSTEVTRIAIPTTDARLGYMLAAYANELLDQASAKGRNSLEDRVLKVIIRRLSSGELSLRTVATELGLGERTLRRRLEKAQLKFGDLVVRARVTLANEWLERTNFDLKHISFLLGYSEPAAFSRAYKRWTGRSPSRVRAA